MKIPALIVAISAVMLVFGSGCKKCQTCDIVWSYEYTDSDPNGNPVTATETGTETSGEECASASDLDDMEAQWEQDAADLKTQLEGLGGQNVSAVLTCARD